MIHIAQLDMLGIHETHRHLIVALLMMVFMYMICRPLINRLITGRHHLFLTYVIVSLLTMNIALALALIDRTLNSIVLSLQVIGLLGLCLMIYILYQLIKQFIQRKVKGRVS